MTWTYTNDLNITRDLVRNLIGDLEEDAYSPTDEVIAYWLDFYDDNAYQAAARIARNMSRRFRTLSTTATDVKIGGMSLGDQSGNFAALADRFDQLAADLEDQSGPDTGTAVPSFAEVDSQFRIGMMDSQ